MNPVCFGVTLIDIKRQFEEGSIGGTVKRQTNIFRRVSGDLSNLKVSHTMVERNRLLIFDCHP